MDGVKEFLRFCFQEGRDRLLTIALGYILFSGLKSLIFAALGVAS